MTDDINRLEVKVDKVLERVGNIDVTLAAQHESLKDHIRRTELLEGEIEPIKKHVAMVGGAMKALGVLALLAGIVEGTVELLAFLRGIHL